MMSSCLELTKVGYGEGSVGSWLCLGPDLAVVGVEFVKHPDNCSNWSLDPARIEYIHRSDYEKHESSCIKKANDSGQRSCLKLQMILDI